MTSLRFENIRIECGEMGKESVVPDIIRHQNVQNRQQYELDEFDEIYEGYGQVPSAYPYRQQDSYSRAAALKEVKAAVLENDLMYAVFLPEFGGRLWKLYDKKNQRDVVYSNDCIRASNLAVRNAWFSGGVEWNCGVIGHSPLTMDQVFAAKVDRNGQEILRMYAYERIRGVVYQMDFWLDERVPALNCHMNIHNPNAEVVPMYWWTNIASPFFQGGRLLVPAHKAYSIDHGTIVKRDIPFPQEGVDVSRYESIPDSRDFFFSLDQEAPRWIANVDHHGRGLLHLSTARLQSRKLFVWGINEGAQHWQNFLTKKAGPYIEVQAGLGKTQYGCIPMAPHTTWEWSERFESLEIPEQQVNMPFDDAVDSLTQRIRSEDAIRAVDSFGRRIRTCRGNLVMEGTGDAALQEALRKHEGLPPMREYLDFSSQDSRQRSWYEFLRTGILPEPEEGQYPDYDPSGDMWLNLLEKSVKRDSGRNWYAYYCISLLQWQSGRIDLAEKAIRKSLRCKETACAEYVQAVYRHSQNDCREAVRSIDRGLEIDKCELSYVKAAICLLDSCKAWEKLLAQVSLLQEKMKNHPRIELCCVKSLYHMKHYKIAMMLLEKDGGLKLDDVREGEIAMGTLWSDLSYELTHERKPVPYQFNFNATDI